MRDLVVEVGIGLHPWEQLRPQRLVVNVEAWAYVGAAYTHDDTGLILDYDAIRDVIREDWPKREHMKLLEPLAEELIQLCFKHPAVEAARVRLEKPDIFSEAQGVGDGALPAPGAVKEGLADAWHSPPPNPPPSSWEGF